MVVLVLDVSNTNWLQFIEMFRLHGDFSFVWFRCGFFSYNNDKKTDIDKNKQKTKRFKITEMKQKRKPTQKKCANKN